MEESMQYSIPVYQKHRTDCLLAFQQWSTITRTQHLSSNGWEHWTSEQFFPSLEIQPQNFRCRKAFHNHFDGDVDYRSHFNTRQSAQWQSCSAHPHIWRCYLLSSPCFLTSPYMERAPGHMTAPRSLDLTSPIYEHVVDLTRYAWPRDLSRDLTSLGPDTCVCVCNGCNMYPITHAQLCEPYHCVELWDPGSGMEK